MRKTTSITSILLLIGLIVTKSLLFNDIKLNIGSININKRKLNENSNNTQNNEKIKSNKNVNKVIDVKSEAYTKEVIEPISEQDIKEAKSEAEVKEKELDILYNELNIIKNYIKENKSKYYAIKQTNNQTEKLKKQNNLVINFKQNNLDYKNFSESLKKLKILSKELLSMIEDKDGSIKNYKFLSEDNKFIKIINNLKNEKSKQISHIDNDINALDIINLYNILNNKKSDFENGIINFIKNKKDLEIIESILWTINFINKNIEKKKLIEEEKTELDKIQNDYKKDLDVIFGKLSFRQVWKFSDIDYNFSLIWENKIKIIDKKEELRSFNKINKENLNEEANKLFTKNELELKKEIEGLNKEIIKYNKDINKIKENNNIEVLINYINLYSKTNDNLSELHLLKNKLLKLENIINKNKNEVILTINNGKFNIIDITKFNEIEIQAKELKSNFERDINDFNKTKYIDLNNATNTYLKAKKEVNNLIKKKII